MKGLKVEGSRLLNRIVLFLKPVFIMWLCGPGYFNFRSPLANFQVNKTWLSFKLLSALPLQKCQDVQLLRKLSPELYQLLFIVKKNFPFSLSIHLLRLQATIYDFLIVNITTLYNTRSMVVDQVILAISSGLHFFQLFTLLLFHFFQAFSVLLFSCFNF